MYNNYLKRRKEMHRPHSSRSEYGRSKRNERDYGMGERYNYPESMRGDYRSRYDRYMDEKPYRSNEHEREYIRPIYVEEHDEEVKDYEHELHEWIERLKKKDRFASSKDDIIRKAKSMEVKFDLFDEEEFYATYLMMVSDYKHVANDPHHYLAMAKEWLMDDDVALTGSDKLCAYLYTIVLGETE